MNYLIGFGTLAIFVVVMMNAEKNRVAALAVALVVQPLFFLFAWTMILAIPFALFDSFHTFTDIMFITSIPILLFALWHQGKWVFTGMRGFPGAFPPNPPLYPFG